MTLKALRVLRSAAVIAYPAPESGESLARGIVAPMAGPRPGEIAIRFPMRPRSAAGRDLLATPRHRSEAVLQAGDDVAYLCAGRPAASTAASPGCWPRSIQAFRSRSCPACRRSPPAPRLPGRPLVQRDETLSVVPATLSEEELARRSRRHRGCCCHQTRPPFPKAAPGSAATRAARIGTLRRTRELAERAGRCARGGRSGERALFCDALVRRGGRWRDRR